MDHTTSQQPIIQLGGAVKPTAADAALRDIAQAVAVAKRAEMRRQGEAEAQRQRDSGSRHTPKSHWKSPKLWLQVFTAVIMTAATAKIFLATDWSTPEPEAPTAPLPQARTPQPQPPVVMKTASLESGGAATAEGRQFSRALERLTGIFELFPDRDPMDVVQQLNAGASPTGPLVCPFGLNAGNEPELLLGRSGSGSIVEAINHCADGAQQLHDSEQRLRYPTRQ